MNPIDLQKSFLDTMLKSDALVIVDFNGYVGQTVACEFGFASYLVLANSRMGKSKKYEHYFQP